jgi:hypothetical protein
MDMKKLLSIVSGDKQTESKQLNEGIDECGSPMSPSMPNTPPVSMSVNLNAQGVDNIKELLNLMRAAESPGRMSEPMAMPEPGMSMPISITKVKPAEEPGGDSGMSQIRDLIKKADTPEEAYANSPDEQYGELDDAVPSGNDLHKEKGSYPKVAGGDNPMAAKESIRTQLDQLYQQIKEAKIEKSGVRASDKKKGKVEKSEKKQYFVKLEKEGKTKGMTIVADEGESQGDVRDRAARDAKSGGWTVASIRVKEEE